MIILKLVTEATGTSHVHTTEKEFWLYVHACMYTCMWVYVTWWTMLKEFTEGVCIYTVKVLGKCI